VAAITATLARYPEDVIRDVTHPATGLPITKDFLPTVREVHRACEAIVQPRREAEAREARTKQQLAERAQFDLIRAAFDRRPDEATGERIAINSEENAA